MVQSSKKPPPLSAPLLRSQVMRVQPEWIDFNGHMNMAYYDVLFDRAVDEVHIALGLGQEYRTRTGSSTFTMENHVCYIAEVSENDPVIVTTLLLDHDAKRMHSSMELFHAEKGYLSATSEQLHTHVDLTTRRSSPFPMHVVGQLDEIAARQRSLPRHPRIGRPMGIRRPTPTSASE